MQYLTGKGILPSFLDEVNWWPLAYPLKRKRARSLIRKPDRIEVFKYTSPYPNHALDQPLVPTPTEWCTADDSPDKLSPSGGLWSYQVWRTPPPSPFLTIDSFALPMMGAGTVKEFKEAIRFRVDATLTPKLSIQLRPHDGTTSLRFLERQAR
jgi:hypothetical protein